MILRGCVSGGDMRVNQQNLQNQQNQQKVRKSSMLHTSLMSFSLLIVRKLSLTFLQFVLIHLSTSQPYIFHIEIML